MAAPKGYVEIKEVRALKLEANRARYSWAGVSALRTEDQQQGWSSPRAVALKLCTILSVGAGWAHPGSCDSGATCPLTGPLQSCLPQPCLRPAHCLLLGRGRGQQWHSRRKGQECRSRGPAPACLQSTCVLKEWTNACSKELDRWNKEVKARKTPCRDIAQAAVVEQGN